MNPKSSTVTIIQKDFSKFSKDQNLDEEENSGTPTLHKHIPKNSLGTAQNSKPNKN
jgi:hypothetical protein